MASEFTFGFAVLSEFVNRFRPLLFAPVLPSLRAESILGYDAHVGIPGRHFFFQFKLAEYCTHGLFGQWRVHRGKYFRASLHPSEAYRQHNTLIALAQSYPDTYYVAPHFFDDAVLNASYLRGDLCYHCAWIPLVECDPILDTKSHCLSWPERRTGFFYQHSSPKQGRLVEHPVYLIHQSKPYQVFSLKDIQHMESLILPVTDFEFDRVRKDYSFETLRIRRLASQLWSIGIAWYVLTDPMPDWNR